MASPNVHEFNDLNFEAEVLKSDQTVLVDFTASWCGPCKLLAPIVDQVADELQGTLKVGKLDIDNAPLTASKYGIQSVPTLILFKGGERARVQTGAVPKSRLLEFVRAD